MVSVKEVLVLEAGRTTRQHVHQMALSRLYWGPSLRMSCPRTTKLVATRGVGAMIVVVILKRENRSQAQRAEELNSSLLHNKRSF